MSRFASMLAVLLFALPARADDWKMYKAGDGWTLERRKRDGSNYYEHRAFTSLPIDPMRAADEIWATMKEGDMIALKRRQILRASENEMIVYDQIKTPVVADRDYTIRVRRLVDAAKRKTEFRCEDANELGPPPAAGYVRIPAIRAGWTTEPDGHGGTRLGYYAYSEPGGFVSAWMVRAAQADRSFADMARMIDRLLKLKR
jgi:hypothetical protein